MKVKITGIISLLGSAGWLIFLSVMFYIEKPKEGDAYLVFGLIIIFLISTLLYVVWTNFKKIDPSELKRIEYENQLLKKKIEQQELKKKLEAE